MSHRITKKRKEEIKKAEEQKKLLKLDLGCGQRKEPGWTGVDIVKVDGVDVVHDLLKVPWPFKDASVEEIRCIHFFEHIPGPMRPRFMDECYRILIPQGKMTLVVPYYNGMRAVQDYNHAWPPVAESSFLYFNKAWLKQNGLDHYDVHCDFDYTWAYTLGPDWATRNQETRDFALKHYTNTVFDLQISLTKR